MVKSQTDDQIVLESLREIDEFQGCSGDCLWDFLGKTFFCVVVTKRHTHAMVNHEAKSQYARLTGFKNYLIPKAKCNLRWVFFLLLLSLSCLGLKNVLENFNDIIQNRTECRVNLTVNRIDGVSSYLENRVIARLPFERCDSIQKQTRRSNPTYLGQDEYLVAKYVDCFDVEKVTTVSNCFNLFRCKGDRCSVNFWTSFGQ